MLGMIFGEILSLLRSLALAVGRTRFLIFVWTRLSSRRPCGFGNTNNLFFFLSMLLCEFLNRQSNL